MSATHDELVAALRRAGDVPWVHNAAITSEIDALRAICLAYSQWWNATALPLLERIDEAAAKGAA
jgi:hypothetical protein